MPANETAEAVSRSVTDLGRRVGLTAQEFNVGLWLAGLLDGEPGAWGFTEQGKRFATEHYHTNGYGGYAHRSWDITTWDPAVIDKLDLSEAGIARIRQFIAERKLAQQAADKAARAAAEAEFLRAQAAKAAAAAPQTVDPARVMLAVLALAGAGAATHGLYKAVPRVRRWWQERGGGPEQTEDGGDR